MEKNQTVLWRTIAIALIALFVGIGIGRLLFASAPVQVSSASQVASSAPAALPESAASQAAGAAPAGMDSSSETATENGGASSGASSAGGSAQASSAPAEPSKDGTTGASEGKDGSAQAGSGASGATAASGASVVEEGSYTSKEEVAAYIHEFGHLPANYISKSKAKKAGWVSKEGNLDEVLPGMSIGGSEFYNDEGLLPDAPGRSWTECDINYEGGYRGAERIVFSNDGLIFYTGDHYESFEQLY